MYIDFKCLVPMALIEVQSIIKFIFWGLSDLPTIDVKPGTASHIHNAISNKGRMAECTNPFAAAGSRLEV